MNKNINKKVVSAFLVLLIALSVYSVSKNVSYLVSLKGTGDYMFLPQPSENSNGNIAFITNTAESLKENSKIDPNYDPYSCKMDPKVGTSTDVYTKGYQLYKAKYYGYPDQGTPCRPIAEKITYIDDGLVATGKYQGYHRVLAFYEAFDQYEGGGSENPADYFISKDLKDFKLVNKGRAAGYFGDTADINSFVRDELNSNKVNGYIESVEFSHPEILSLGSVQYIFMGYDISTSTPTLLSKNLSKKLTTNNGLDIFESSLDRTSFGAYGYGTMGIETDEYKKQKKVFDELSNYYGGLTKIKARNQAGIIANYEISIAHNSKDSVRTSSGSKVSKSLFRPGVLYEDDITTTEKIFAAYGQITTTPCGGTYGSYIGKNISLDELTKIGATKNGIELYTFKNKQHPIIKAQYIEKVTQYDKETFMSLNEGLGITKIPTYDEYVANNPVLLFKDVWGRLVILGENEFGIEAGCGKPVIYLYPEKKTEVGISFANEVTLATQIPAYKNGWRVIAEKSGVLHNSNSDNCDLYQKPHHGSEYAHEACIKNEYPYIYWSGNAYNEYPSIKEGFVVKKENLKVELEQKLKEIGLNEKESSDMVSYWYPEMLKKNSPFYRIAFLQTKELNTFLPMNVSPKPNSTLRIFLDWEPLNEFVKIPPQKFEPFVRSGFTYVEWGGLKR